MVALDTILYIAGPAILAVTTAVRASRDGLSTSERRAFGAFAVAFAALSIAGVGLATGGMAVAAIAVAVAVVPAAVGFTFYYRGRGAQGARA